jgi:hypothetical protein
MMRTTLYGWMMASALTLAACSGAPGTPASPTGGSAADAALNPDGSNLKVTAPTGLSPSSGTVDSRRPTLSFNGSSGVFQPAPIAGYELEVFAGNNTLAYSRASISTVHMLESDLTFADTYTWRVRARLGDQFGPWSEVGSFRTPDPPPPPPPTPTTPTGGLPFPIPAECGPGGPGNRIGCVLAVASQSAEWNGCAAGSGTRCHRFTRQVVYALSQSDPNWKMIQAAPGGHACNCNFCGPSDGTMFREDTTVYAGSQVFDMIVGAGGPTPSLNWSFVGAPRNVDGPGDAPLCVP